MNSKSDKPSNNDATSGSGNSMSPNQGSALSQQSGENQRSQHSAYLGQDFASMNKQQEEQNQKLKMQKSPSKEKNSNNNAAAPPRTASKEVERRPAEPSHSGEAMQDERNGMPIAWRIGLGVAVIVGIVIAARYCCKSKTPNTTPAK
ncbi:hypothetical protein WR25_12042 [Diploscapter pachys]|uniref:Uncharacterized protein n=1 Tax=Diploscapter pachys TaxID=2018661 RepID=A0A2A2LM96_9BILA|nr:hypothetical protein WR25_12042 [Diploscapter pachys]